MTPWPILLILVCMDRGDKYLSIDNKTKFLGGLVAKNLGRGLQQPPLVGHVTKKIAWLDEGSRVKRERFC